MNALCQNCNNLSHSHSVTAMCLCSWWRWLLLPLDCLLVAIILPPLLVCLVIIFTRAILLPSGQSIGHPAINSLNGIPVSYSPLEQFLNIVHALAESKPVVLYFASLGPKLGAIARRILYVRNYFRDGTDAATVQAQRKVEMLGGLRCHRKLLGVSGIMSPAALVVLIFIVIRRGLT